MDPVVQIAVALAFAVLWLTAAASKLRGFREFAAVVADYRVAPYTVAPAISALIVALELGLGVALLMQDLRTAALAVSAALLVLYATVIGINLLRGRRHIDCGCTAASTRQPLSGWLVWRNLVLAIAALAGALPPESRLLNWVDALSVFGAVAAVCVLYAALHQLAANSRELPGLRR